MKYYFVGIKGSGMSALANILLDLGYEIGGVDYDKKHYTDSINERVKIDNFTDVFLTEDNFYIIGNAFKLHELTLKIISKGYKYDYYPSFIENFFKMEKIGVTGSHGKTTTTSFISQLLGNKTNALIGDGTGLGYKDADMLVLEACEYQNTFLNYTFDYLVILNIDYDHPDFFKSNNEYLFAFQKASLKAKMLIINNDCKNCKKIIHSNKITFGMTRDSDVYFKIIEDKIIVDFFGEILTFDYPFYSPILAYDLVASLIIKYVVTNEILDTITKVKDLKFPKRRLEEVQVNDGLILVCDYAHHPTEISVVIRMLKSKYLGFKIAVVYQGHTYSRTQTFLHEYTLSLKEADEVFIMPTFSSVRENDVDNLILLKQDTGFKKYERAKIEELINKKGYIVVFLGAGDIDSEFIFFLKKVNY